MRVVALLPVRNEELYLARCLEHLYAQGIETCVIDNDSTDRTVEIARTYAGRGVFRIERLPYEGCYQWEAILKFEEQLAGEIDADWFMHQDADEIRQAPNPYKTLLEGITAADRLGFNAINFDEFVFLPTEEDDSFAGRDYVRDMQRYYFFEPWPRRQVKAWKQLGLPVGLHAQGGHAVDFPGRKIFPQPFILRHYIVLSRAHALQKYGGRIYSRHEVADLGWHGARPAFTAERLAFPPPARLRLVTPDNTWDKSEPWYCHEFLGETPPAWNPFVSLRRRVKDLLAILGHERAGRPR